MLVNNSYNEPKVTTAIEALVGPPFKLSARWKLGGVGSPQLLISQSSAEIHSLLVLDHNTNSCNIELRPEGIILRFRSLLETYALVIPYYKLQLYKGKASEYSVYMDHYFVKVHANDSVHRFFRKLRVEKNKNTPPSVDEL